MMFALAGYLSPGYFGWKMCVIFGAMRASSDPVSMLARFKEPSVGPRLITIISAESIVNDGCAGVFFDADFFSGLEYLHWCDRDVHRHGRSVLRPLACGFVRHFAGASAEEGDARRCDVHHHGVLYLLLQLARWATLEDRKFFSSHTGLTRRNQPEVSGVMCQVTQDTALWLATHRLHSTGNRGWCGVRLRTWLLPGCLVCRRTATYPGLSRYPLPLGDKCAITCYKFCLTLGHWASCSQHEGCSCRRLLSFRF